MDKIPMTVAGEAALKEELEHLKQVERPRIVAEISEALAQGDLRENAEYQYAKEEQGFIEGRITEVAAKLSNAQIIDITSIPHSGKVILVSLSTYSRSRTISRWFTKSSVTTKRTLKKIKFLFTRQLLAR